MPPKWIAPRLRCGLGNRLFQTVATVSAAERTGSEAVLFLPRMSHFEHGSFTVLHSLFPNLRIVETESEWLEITETDTSEIPQINTDKPVVLTGFFQNSKNFPSPAIYPRLPNVACPRKAWAVHFRFGDYCLLPHHQINGLNRYYYQAIAKIPIGSTITLFSDSPERLPKIAEELTNYNVEIFTNSDILETLKAFAACQEGSVCGNSTFSWWAAFFAANTYFSTTYKAYFPDKWINDKAPKVFTLPFTQVIEISSLPAFPILSSFSFS